MNSSDIMALADDFVKGFYAGDILVITPPEDMKPINDPVLDTARNVAHSLIRSNLGDAIHLHATERTEETARKLVKLITSARNHGMIAESESNISKGKRLKQENAQLKEDNAKLQKEILRLNKLNEQLHMAIERLTPRTDNGNGVMKP